MPNTCPPRRICAARSISQPCARKKARSAIVDLLPGKITRVASAGRGCPGGTITRLTSGSDASGSKSSKFAIRDKSGTAILSFPSPPSPSSGASSAGKRQASKNHGTTPIEGHPVNASIALRPSSKRRTSPRNLFTIKALIWAVSSGGKTACVPTI